MQHEYEKDRNNYRKLIVVLCVQSVVAIALVCCLAWTVIWPAKKAYNITTENGSILPVFPLSAPMVSDSRIEQWAGLRAREAYNLNFFTWKKQISALKPYFTADGYSAIMSAYKDSNLIESLKSSKLVISSVVTRAPTILAKGAHKGHYTWKVQMPLLVTYNSANIETKSYLNVTMLIQRVPVMDQSAGIAINTFHVTTASGSKR